MSSYKNIDHESAEFILEAELGVDHSNRITPQNPRPGDAVTLHITVGAKVLADSVYVVYSTDGDPIIETTKNKESFYSCIKGTLIDAKLSDVSWNADAWGYLHHFEATLPAFPDGTRVSYFIFAWSETEQKVYFADSSASNNHDNVESMFNERSSEGKGLEHYERHTVTEMGRATRFVYQVDNTTTPEWAHGAIFYQVFLDRFHPGPNQSFAEYGEGKALSFADILGGTLAGLRYKLSYLYDLGVTALWLSPCYPSNTHHGYDVIDYRAVNSRLGTMEEMKALVSEVHALGMHIILDFVPNHVSNEQEYFQSAISDENSPYRDWFHFINWPDHYEAFFAEPTLPKINTNSPAAREYLIESARFWLDDVGIDGFRMDHAQGVTTTFWSDYRTLIKSTSPNALTIGEITETSPFLSQYQGRLDGVLDFIWVHEARNFFIFNSIDAPSFEHFLTGHDLFFPDKDFLLPTFLDNHDMNRFLWTAKGDIRRLKLAALCQFTQKAPPIIYYGTEVGLSQEWDVHQGDVDVHEASRMPMIWGDEQDKDLHSFYRRLIHFRREYPASYKGERISLLVASKGLLVYGRQYENETVITALNNSDLTHTVTVSLKKLMQPILADFKNIEAEEVVIEDQKITLTLLAREGELLVSQSNAST
ncbi:MAG: alpha-amylase family glycosyl hydrolase [Methylococcales bacterium]|nr:alpha-amylase family glycosyl hydrolase [Methylococcales bacterium]